MRLTETKLAGAFIIEAERFEDERGFFARSWSQREFAEHGLNPLLVECNISFNRSKGTLRGMHFQRSPHEQTKVVRCTLGAIYDVIVDLRPSSPTFKQWIGAELTSENRLMLYIQEGFAHGFQTLEDGSEVFYQMSSYYAPESAGGVRWNDAAFGIEWPHAAERIINARDRQYPDFVL
ncbi:MAG: dTDP-4-dehydrorhamnose 3,5-epimerase [Acidobacteriota bacterium]|nr:dTDP-4-dehydrorhamnose 3,5-epimerase [Acidobacteriota bacterium]